MAQHMRYGAVTYFASETATETITMALPAAGLRVGNNNPSTSGMALYQGEFGYYWINKRDGALVFNPNNAGAGTVYIANYPHNGSAYPVRCVRSK